MKAALARACIFVQELGACMPNWLFVRTATGSVRVTGTSAAFISEYGLWYVCREANEQQYFKISGLVRHVELEIQAGNNFSYLEVFL